jgi:hypothetical protein
MSQLAFTRPRSITEIIDATFRFYRARFGDMVVLAAILLVPPALIAAIVPASLERATLFATNLMYAITNGAIAFLVAAALERNETLSASDVLRQFGSRAGNVLGVAIATGIAAVIGFILLIVPGVFVVSWTMVAVPVAAIEGLGIIEAMRRSRALARGRMGHVLGTAFLTSLIFFALFIGLGMMLGVVAGMIGLPARLIASISRIAVVPLVPLFGIAVTMLYYDLRVRGEGADVAAMIDTLPATPAHSA